MDILLAIAAIAVGASGLYVSVTFSRRTQRTADPMISRALRPLSERLKAYDTAHLRELRELRAEVQEFKVLFKTDVNSVVRITNELTLRSNEIVRESNVAGQRTTQLATSLGSYLDHARQIDRGLSALEARNSEFDARLQGALRDVGRRGAEIDNKLVVLRQMLEDRPASSARSQPDQWITDQLLEVVKQLETVLREQREVQSFLNARLARETLLTLDSPLGRVISAAVHLREPAADLLWPLVGSFCDAVSLTPLFGLPPSPTSRSSYVLWTPPDSRVLEGVLGDRLSALPSRSAPDAPGLAELRNLAAGLHVSSTGSAQIGPMIITRTTDALFGYVLARAEASDLRRASHESPEAYEDQVRQLRQSRVVELTEWADALLS